MSGRIQSGMLNLIINAAHAIEQAQKQRGRASDKIIRADPTRSNGCGNRIEDTRHRYDVTGPRTHLRALCFHHQSGQRLPDKTG